MSFARRTVIEFWAGLQSGFHALCSLIEDYPLPAWYLAVTVILAAEFH